MREFMKTVRGASSKAVWSRGVELSRADAVSLEAESGNEVNLRVVTRGGLIAPTVTLYVVDEEWECSCSSEDDPCEHVAAATIALAQARKQGKSLARMGEANGSLRYCLTRNRPGLAIEREIVTGNDRFLLESSLDAIARGRVDGPKFIASPADLAVERVLGPNRRGPIPAGILSSLFEALEACPDVLLDSQEIRVSRDEVLPGCRVVDAPGGFRLFLEGAPQVSEALGDGVVISQGVLCRAGELRLDGRERQDLTRGRFFAHGQLAELIGEVLPSLSDRIRVEIDTDKLPETSSSERARILIESERTGDRLSLLPLLVYGDPPVARVDGDNLVHLQGKIPLRDRSQEALRVRQLREELGLSPGHRVEFSGAEAVSFTERLKNWGGNLRGSGHHDFYLRPDLVADLVIDDNRLDLSFRSPEAGKNAGDSQSHGPQRRDGVASTAAVLRAFREGESLVALETGGFAALPQNWLARFGDRVADLLEARKQDGSIAVSALPDLARLCDDLDHPRPAAIEELRPLFEDFDGIPRAELPADFEGTLRPYQQAGVDWLCFMRSAGLGALLADDMGLGKTVQALCALEGRALVVCPTSVLFNWADELRRFRPNSDFCLYHGPRRSLDDKAPIVVTSYAILRLDAQLLCAQDWDIVVLDEAQNIKNPASQVAQVAYDLPAKFRVALTGTPVENRLDELWSQLHFLNPGLLGGRRDFRDRYARPIAEGRADVGEKLRRRIRPFLLRRKKRDVAPELPPRTEIVLHCELSEEERAVYDAIRAATVNEVVTRLQAGGSVLAALEALLRLRQAACHSGLVPGQTADGSSKLSLLVSRLEEAVADGHKALVFSQWTSLLDRVEPHLRAAEIDFERLDGATANRSKPVERFQSNDGAPVMLVSLKAGGTGLNLTAADHIFLLDPWWNPAVEDQAADRAHRIGQTRPVVVHRLVAQDTVEEGILELHARKRALSEVALGSHAEAQGLTRKDLLALLS